MQLNFRPSWLFKSVPRLPFYYGWVIVGVAVLAQLVSGFGHPYVATVFIESMRNEFGWSLTLLSALYTGGSLLAAALILIMGRLLDRYGSRIMLTFICVLMGLVTMSMSLIQQPVHLFAGFAVIRLLGDTSLNLVSITLVAMWFVRLRGRATSLASMGLATSHSALPVLTHFLIAQLGWRNAYIALGCIIWLILLVPATLFARRSPESVGLLPDGESSKDVKPEDALASREEVSFTLPEALRTRTFWLLLVCSISFPLTITGLLFHHVPLMQTKGISTRLAATVLLLWGPCMMVGNFIAGFLADKIKIRFLLAAGLMVLAFVMLWIRWITSPWQAFVYIIIAGTCGGVFFTSYAVTLGNYFGRRHLGAIRGLTSANTLLFSALGALPFGVIFDMTGSYDTATLILLVLPLLSCVAALLALPPTKEEEGVKAS